MPRRPIDDTETDFMAIIADIDSRMHALSTRVGRVELEKFDRRATVAANALNRAMTLTFDFCQKADARLTPRPRPSNVITLRPRARKGRSR